MPLLHAISEESPNVTPNSERLSDTTSWIDYRALVAQLVEHRVVVREVVSSTPAGPTLRVLK